MRINKKTLSAICDYSSGFIMVYGYKTTEYKRVAQAICSLRIIPLLCFYQGPHGIEPEVYTPKKICQTGIVNLIIENVQRYRDKKPQIPLIFCLERERPRFQPAELSFLDPKSTSITDAELRRAYRLCLDLRIDPMIRDIAQQTMHFVRVIKTSATYTLDPLPPPWQKPGLEEALNCRRLTKQHSLSGSPDKTWIGRMHQQCGLTERVKDNIC